jgi:hypothetical protein
MSEFKPIKSSNLEAESYDAANQELVIRFKNGTAYKYFNVSPDLYREFKEADSAGSFFHLHIRRMEFEQLENWK